MTTHEKIDQLLSEHNAVLFMKGTPQMPLCGFSARATALLQDVGAKFHTINVLEDSELREGIKAYGNWPTIPQLYVNKELIGGSDILMEMHQAGRTPDFVQSMKMNLSLIDRVLRYGLGIALVTWAVAGGPFWMYVGVYLIVTASWGLCPVYAYFNLRTLKLPDRFR